MAMAVAICHLEVAVDGTQPGKRHTRLRAAEPATDHADNDQQGDAERTPPNRAMDPDNRSMSGGRCSPCAVVWASLIGSPRVERKRLAENSGDPAQG
jgi:hypothetical protein